MLIKTYTPAQQTAFIDALGEMRSIGVGSWMPNLAANTALWLRGDLGITITSSRVSAWADQSGTGNHFIQAALSSDPVTGTLLGKPALRFDGISRFLQRTGYTAPVTDGEWWAVYSTDSATGSSLWDWSGATSDYFTYVGDGKIYDQTGSTARKTCGTPITSITVGNVVSVKSAAGAWSMYLNGTLQFTTVTNTYAVTANPRLGLSATYLTGYLAEVWNGRIMSSADRAKARTYITRRYGLTLGADWV